MQFPKRSNPVEIRDGFAVVFLKRQCEKLILECLIDISDLSRVLSNGSRWHAQWNPCTKSFYAIGRPSPTEKSMLGMHRLIMGFPAGMDIDHINHNTLDNRRTNLRSVPHHVNMLNRKSAPANSSSGIRGVRWTKGSWRADIESNKQKFHLGSFASKEDAAAAFQAKFNELSGLSH